MSMLLVVEPMSIASISASRGVGAAFLPTPDPKEVWADTATGTTTITIDLGVARTIDTIFLGHLRGSAAGTTWSITNGDTNGVIQATTAMRVPDVTGTFAALSHALWYGSETTVRTIKLALTQPTGSAVLSAGSLVIGRTFAAELGNEWGAGRQPIDTGSATPLPSGGFAIVEGVRKRRYAWTFGDLSQDEVDRLELIALALGETKPGLVIEDADRTSGLRSRIHYGRFERWRTFERRNRRQTRWEVSIEEWA